MAEAASDQSPARIQTEARSGSDHQSSQYWCYSCDKRVAIETLADLPDVVCYECKNGFVESISAAAIDPLEDPNFGSQFIQVLNLIAQVAREENGPSDASVEDLQIELDNEDEEEEEEEDDNDEEQLVEVEREEEADDNRENEAENNRSYEEEGIEVNETRGEDEEIQRRCDYLRLRLWDYASRAASRRILNWADVLMGLENHPLEHTYVGNPGDYVNASEYEALLQNLAESDSGARRGAPPAAKAAVEGLKSVEIVKEENAVVCAICKELVNVGEIAKNLPCGHGYHGECIVPWLGSRNTCPVCRFELPTDDLEYEGEKQKKKRVVVAGLRAASTGSSSSTSASDGTSPE